MVEFFLNTSHGVGLAAACLSIGEDGDWISCECGLEKFIDIEFLVEFCLICLLPDNIVKSKIAKDLSVSNCYLWYTFGGAGRCYYRMLLWCWYRLLRVIDYSWVVILMRPWRSTLLLRAAIMFGRRIKILGFREAIGVRVGWASEAFLNEIIYYSFTNYQVCLKEYEEMIDDVKKV